MSKPWTVERFWRFCAGAALAALSAAKRNTVESFMVRCSRIQLTNAGCSGGHEVEREEREKANLFMLKNMSSSIPPSDISTEDKPLENHWRSSIDVHTSWYQRPFHSSKRAHHRTSAAGLTTRLPLRGETPEVSQVPALDCPRHCVVEAKDNATVRERATGKGYQKVSRRVAFDLQKYGEMGTFRASANQIRK